MLSRRPALEARLKSLGQQRGEVESLTDRLKDEPAVAVGDSPMGTGASVVCCSIFFMSLWCTGFVGVGGHWVQVQARQERYHCHIEIFSVLKNQFLLVYIGIHHGFSMVSGEAGEAQGAV